MYSCPRFIAYAKKIKPKIIETMLPVLVLIVSSPLKFNTIGVPNESQFSRPDSSSPINDGFFFYAYFFSTGIIFGINKIYLNYLI
jgi:hypothetical protein